MLHSPSRPLALQNVALIALLGASLACNTLFPPKPKIEWDTDPSALILESSTSGGMLYEPNAISDARLWGDGRLVWVEYASDHSRRVMEAQLSSDDITALLRQFVDAGFFGWEDSYSPGIVYDAPITCVRVALSSTVKSVCEVISGAPAKFSDLYDFVHLTQVTGTEFTPTRGYLSAQNVGPSGVALMTWPAEALDFSLAQAQGGVWVEGKTLELAWQLVNTQPLNPVVTEGGSDYSLILLIPSLTEQQPPTP